MSLWKRHYCNLKKRIEISPEEFAISREYNGSEVRIIDGAVSIYVDEGECIYIFGKNQTVIGATKETIQVGFLKVEYEYFVKTVDDINKINKNDVNLEVNQDDLKTNILDRLREKILKYQQYEEISNLIAEVSSFNSTRDAWGNITNINSKITTLSTQMAEGFEIKLSGLYIARITVSEISLKHDIKENIEKAIEISEKEHAQNKEKLKLIIDMIEKLPPEKINEIKINGILPIVSPSTPKTPKLSSVPDRALFMSAENLATREDLKSRLDIYSNIKKGIEEVFLPELVVLKELTLEDKKELFNQWIGENTTSFKPNATFKKEWEEFILWLKNKGYHVSSRS